MKPFPGPECPLAGAGSKPGACRSPAADACLSHAEHFCGELFACERAVLGDLAIQIPVPMITGMLISPASPTNNEVAESENPHTCGITVEIWLVRPLLSMELSTTTSRNTPNVDCSIDRNPRRAARSGAQRPRHRGRVEPGWPR